MLKNLPLKLKLLLSFLGVSLVVLLVGLVGIKGSRDLSGQIETLGTLELQKVEHLLKIKVEFTNFKEIVASFLNPNLKDKEREQLFEQLKTIRTNYSASKEVYAKLIQNTQEKEEWEKFLAALKEWKSVDDRFFALAQKVEASKIKNPLEYWAKIESYQGYHYLLLNKTQRMLLTYRKFSEGLTLQDCPFTSWLETQLKTSNPDLKKILLAVKNAHRHFHQSLAKVKAAFIQGDLKKAISTFRNQLYPQSEQLFLHLQQLIAFSKEIKDTYNQMLVFREKEIKPKMEKTFYHLNNLVKLVLKEANLEVKEAQTTTKKVFMLILGGILLGIILALVLGALLGKLILSPLKKSVGFAQEVAKGNLQATISLDQKDEIGLLVQSLTQMLEALKDKIKEAEHKTKEAEQEKEKAASALKEAQAAREAAEKAKKEGMLEAANQIKEVVNSLSTASEELSSQIEQTLKGAEMSKNLVAETATAMEEMNASVLEVARNTSGVAKDAEDSQEKAKEGAQIVKQVVESITEVQNKQAKESKENLGLLSSKIQEIDKIINVIEDIADQTNLLALNAAIEAARAGDAGRGFAVVADEVRKLAEKTMLATKEVGEVITGIQEKARETVQSVDVLTHSISEATKLATTSGKVLEEIVQLSLNVAHQIQTIATATEEQSATSEEINRNIAEVSQITTEATKAMQESSRALLELAKLAQNLQGLIQKMQEDSKN